jgi:hypothetical protein
LDGIGSQIIDEQYFKAKKLNLNSSEIKPMIRNVLLPHVQKEGA